MRGLCGERDTLTQRGDAMTFGESVRQDRRDLGLTQTQIAQLAEINQGRLSDIERGIAPKPEEREALERILGKQPA